MIDYLAGQLLGGTMPGMEPGGVTLQSRQPGDTFAAVAVPRARRRPPTDLTDSGGGTFVAGETSESWQLYGPAVPPKVGDQLVSAADGSAWEVRRVSGHEGLGVYDCFCILDK